MLFCCFIGDVDTRGKRNLIESSNAIERNSFKKKKSFCQRNGSYYACMRVLCAVLVNISIIYRCIEYSESTKRLERRRTQTNGNGMESFFPPKNRKTTTTKSA